MKRLLLIFALFVVGMSSLLAQNISVESFRLDEMDLTANQQGTIVLDQNGEKCALIKIRTTQTGFSFDVGSLGVQKTEQKAGEVWVYVPHGVRKITIQHAQLGTCEYTIPINVDKARTYIMQLTTGQVQTSIKNAVTAQYVLFDIVPKNASVELDGEILETVDGTATAYKPFGTYNYRIQAPRHQVETGIVTINDAKNKHIVSIHMKPAYANVTFKADADEEVWINDLLKGSGTQKVELGFGTYNVELRKAGHRPLSQTITISQESDGKIIKLEKPVAMYGTLNVNSTPANANIFIDDVIVGTTPMFVEDILIGSHNLKIQKSGYIAYTATVTINENETTQHSAKLLERKLQVLKKGPCGDDAYFELTKDGTLSIYGNGKMWDYGSPYFNDTKTLLGNNNKDVDYVNEIIINHGITYVGNSAFSHYKSCTSISLPESVLGIGHSAFSNCQSLSNITIPDSITSLDDDTFVNCFRLSSITLPCNISSIGRGVFYGCNNLESIVIPKSAKNPSSLKSQLVCNHTKITDNN